jgi:DNA processing protein
MRTLATPTLSWIGLNTIPGVGRTTFRKLVSRFGTPEQALSASEEELKKTGGLSDTLVNEVRTYPWREHAEQELAKARDAGVAIVTLDDADYPVQLRNSPDPPLYLYVKGELLPEDAKAVAIVGTRKPTHYGLTMTHRIAYELASAGLTIVSGMARGIDTQAHRGALAAKGRTIAVLGCGIDVAYPPENRGLIDQIGRSGLGAVVAENPFGTKPEAGYFPARNRIISGLAQGTVIIEAAEDSGSLITAEYAVKQGRQLFALPGNIGSPNSRGPNSLIKEGALLVEDADDILKALRLPRTGGKRTSPEPAPRIPLTQEEEAVFRHITNEPKHIDMIMTESGATAGKISGLLITLELKGLARQLPGKFFVREG